MICIPSKADKVRSTLVDSIRLLAWTMYKSQHKLQGQQAFAGYPAFETEWLAHEIHKMDLKGVQKFIKSLGYSEEELLEDRSKYYERKRGYNNSQTSQETAQTEAPNPFDTEVADEFEYPEPPY
ncbi:hypothetical protein NG799_01695 [Laspinema sp. D1]|uniref:Uncharacterized protein n=2 Tax=Laspinema TaxID=2584823 RepID=A0ABT2MJW6_9CYAN|nr:MULTISPECIES: hypothetical protein [unclassified Laspinema]MCT7965044.1 hypothetical protein [Laspinema sp. D2a]MCT7977669.1 hypothetical protein [Laspinema sp. D3b]MCT7992514.1 hypothetical protein [Laspinema sp. D3c]